MMGDYTQQQKAFVHDLEQSFVSGNVKSTVVQMQQDYLHDDQMCLTSVVLLPEELVRAITEQVIEPLRSIEPQHYYSSFGSMHLTIKNVRTIHKPPLFTSSDVEKVDAMFQQLIPTFPAFDFSIEDVIPFATSVSVMGYCDEVQRDLVLALDRGLKEIGVPDDKKYLSDSVFCGNISVCRFVEKPGEAFMAELKRLRNVKIGILPVERISLVTCNAVCAKESRKVIGECRLGS